MTKVAGTARCVNFGGCSKADSKEAIEVAAGGDRTCPECGKALTAGAAGGKTADGAKKSPLVLLLIAGVVLFGSTAAYLMWPSEEPQPGPVPGKEEPIPAPTAPDPNPNPNPDPAPPQPGPDPAPTPNPEPGPTPSPIPQPGPDPVGPPPRPRPVPQPKPNLEPAPGDPTTQPKPQPEPAPATYNGPSQGTLVWEGEVPGTDLITIQDGQADRGRLISGKLPGVAVIIQPLDEKRVAISAAPQPSEGYRRLVFRVKNKGKTRVTLRWALP
jgi:hypothetical protein